MKSKPSPKQKVRKVKAWCVVSGNGSLISDVTSNGEYVLGAATLVKHRAQKYAKHSKEYWDDDARVIPCTISYPQ